MSPPTYRALATETVELTSFSRVPVGVFSCSASLPRRRFSSDPVTLGFPQPWMTWGDTKRGLEG